MNKLFSAFNITKKKEWIEKISTDLKGADYNEKLVSDTQEIEISPIYHANDNTPIYNSYFPEDWDSYQLINAKNPKEGNKRALEALQNDPAEQEKFAREKFLMKKENEDIFIIREKENE